MKPFFWCPYTLTWLVITCSWAQAQEAVSFPNAVAIDQFTFRYGLEHSRLPLTKDLGRIQVNLTRWGKIWHAPSEVSGENLLLNAAPAGSLFDASALRVIAQAIVNWFNVRGIYGVWVTFGDFDTTGAKLTDSRLARGPTARIVIWAQRRWAVELCFRDIKTTLSLDVLRCESPKLIEKEIWLQTIAYNLVRALMVEAAWIHSVPLDRLSFKRHRRYLAPMDSFAIDRCESLCG